MARFFGCVWLCVLYYISVSTNQVEGAAAVAQKSGMILPLPICHAMIKKIAVVRQAFVPET